MYIHSFVWREEQVTINLQVKMPKWIQLLMAFLGYCQVVNVAKMTTSKHLPVCSQNVKNTFVTCRFKQTANFHGTYWNPSQHQFHLKCNILRQKSQASSGIWRFFYKADWTTLLECWVNLKQTWGCGSVCKRQLRYEMFSWRDVKHYISSRQGLNLLRMRANKETKMYI